MKNILNELLNGNLSVVTDELSMIMTNKCLEFLNGNDSLNSEIYDILMISNILYNNTDLEMLPLEDGLYDLVLEKFRAINIDVPVGAPVVHFNPTNNVTSVQNTVSNINPISFIENPDKMFYLDDIMRYKKFPLTYINPISIPESVIPKLAKRKVSVGQEYPKLVGTLLKSKFVLMKQAEEKGVANNPNVLVLERDFFGKHIMEGILDPNRIIRMVLELKYDGISVVNTVSSNIKNSYSRGDTDNNLAADYTDILKNYIFPDAVDKFREEDTFGLKCEAIMTYQDLEEYGRRRNKKYANPRNAISGLMSSDDANLHTDLITLMPISTSIEGIDRLTELEFLNKYYTRKEYMRYTVIEGNYYNILYLIKKFVDEAEYLRPFMPFMYDGVVISYIDKDIVNALGRKNSINMYSMAIKFNAMKKQTILRDIVYSVGQNGVITPKAIYDTIEFFGNIQSETTLSSKARFESIKPRIGDIIDIEYVNDVMSYITKPDNTHNLNNTNPEFVFPTHCPYCGGELIESDTGKSIYCINTVSCPGILLARTTNMINKLNMKDFAEANISKLSKYSLQAILETTYEEAVIAFDNSEVIASKFMDRINELKEKPIYDYMIVGALGFTDIAQKTWKLILNNITLREIIKINPEELYHTLCNIKGIGSIIANTIIEEMPIFIDDISYILSTNNIVITKGATFGKKIRFSGFRDNEIASKLNELGFDADLNASVTKDTSYLLVNDLSYTSSKVTNANKHGIPIIQVDEFMNNIDLYL